jgi:hypothetical protein
VGWYLQCPWLWTTVKLPCCMSSLQEHLFDRDVAGVSYRNRTRRQSERNAAHWPSCHDDVRHVLQQPTVRSICPRHLGFEVGFGSGSVLRVTCEGSLQKPLLSLWVQAARLRCCRLGAPGSKSLFLTGYSSAHLHGILPSITCVRLDGGQEGWG